MRIGIVAKAKQGDLLEALEKRGWNQRQMADFLGIDQNRLSRLLNLRWVPRIFSDHLTQRLMELTGKTPEQLFPEWARKRDFLDTPKVRKIIFEATPEMVEMAGGGLRLLSSPEDVSSAHELEVAITNALESLSPKEREVIERTVMGDETQEEVGQSMNLTGGRIQQIKERALRKLRHPNYSRPIRRAANI